MHLFALVVASVLAAPLAASRDSAGRGVGGSDVAGAGAEPDDLRWVRGVNYVPSYSHNDVATWQDYDASVVAEELGWAAAAGFNAVRVFLSSLPWMVDAPRFRASLASLLAEASGLGLAVQLVTFDSCCRDVDADVSWIASGEYKNASWFPNPGPRAVANASAWPLYERYLADVVAVARQAPPLRALLWDIMNEPRLPDSLAFIAHMSALVATLDAGRLRTVGVAQSALNTPALTGALSLLSFHNYAGGAGLADDIAGQRALAAALRLPLLLTESMARPAQPLATVLPAVFACGAASDNASVGFFVWELMLGVDQFNYNWQAPYQGLVFPRWAPPPDAPGSWRFPDERALLANFFASGCPVPPTWLPDTAPEFGYAPPDAWTAWSGAGPANGTLHYADQAGAVASVAVAVAANASALTLVYKRGPDCGIFSAAVDGTVVVPAEDSYRPDPDWAATLRIPIAPAGGGVARTHILDISVTGAASPAATHNYVQVVGVIVS